MENTPMVMEITDANFKTNVEAEGFALVDFWGEGCGPCIQLAPVLAELAKEVKDLKVFKMNVYESPEVPSEFGIRGIPTLILFKDGKKVATKVGFLPKSNLIEWLQAEMKL